MASYALMKKCRKMVIFPESSSGPLFLLLLWLISRQELINSVCSEPCGQTSSLSCAGASPATTEHRTATNRSLFACFGSYLHIFQVLGHGQGTEIFLSFLEKTEIICALLKVSKDFKELPPKILWPQQPVVWHSLNQLIITMYLNYHQLKMYELFLCVSFTKHMIPAFLWNLLLSFHWVFYFPISSLSLLSLSFLSLWWLCSVHPPSFVSGSGNISQDVWLIHHLDNHKKKTPQFPAMNIHKKHKRKKNPSPWTSLPALLFI